MKSFDLTLHLDVTVNLQDDEYNEISADADAHNVLRRRAIREAAEHCAINALQYGVQQYEGALISVIAKGAD